MYVRYVILYTRGEAGIDWDIDNPSQSAITKVYYGVIDRRGASSLSGCSYTYYVHNI